MKTIAVDLDGTLAHYDGWKGIEHIGDPIPRMLARVRRWRVQGHEVVIFTARVSWSHEDWEGARDHIKYWLHDLGLGDLRVTADKSPSFDEIWDARAVSVEKNVGQYTTCLSDHYRK